MSAATVGATVVVVAGVGGDGSVLTRLDGVVLVTVVVIVLLALLLLPGSKSSSTPVVVL